ncbi:MAG: C10 family peptidase [Bacteroidales bacterium]|nr:C10 family peptidase [Bacteroidales bacterium]
MRHWAGTLFFALLVCYFTGSGQNVVTESEAVSVSTGFMRHFWVEKSFQTLEVSHIRRLERNGQALLYEVCYRNGGSALVSGVKSLMPVLGYRPSDDGMPFLASDETSGLSHFVEKYAACVAAELERKPDSIHQAWESLAKDSVFPMQKKNVYGPYLTSRWKQTSSNDGQANAYNYYVARYCDRENRCAAGCVPVAMAQIMHYWEYPVWRPNKRDKYDWANMPDELRLYHLNGNQKDTNRNYETERNAVARLLFDCGAAAKVTYCISECQSFAWPLDARNALVDKFDYQTDAHLIKRTLNASEWKNSIKANIMDGKPVFYAAVDEVLKFEGHAFVCDGYDAETDMFHFNWGWGGDGAWVSIDEINSGSDDWNNMERAVVDICPSGKQGLREDTHLRESLKISPNPVTGTLHIELPEGEMGWTDITIYSLLGKTVLQKGQTSQTEVDVSSLPADMYLLKLRTSEGNSLTAKFVRK